MPFELGHGLDRALYRRLVVDPVHVVQVDDVGAEARQARRAGLPDPGRVVVDGARAVGARPDGELGRQEDVVALAAAPEPLAHALLAARVDVGRVPEPLANLVRPVEQRERRLDARVLLPVPPGEAHQAQADARDPGAVSAKLARGDGVGHVCVRVRSFKVCWWL